MVDNQNPENQFHPYQPVDATPQSERSSTGNLKDMMSKEGLNDMLAKVDVKRTLDQVRNYARANPGKVLGGLAAVIIGAGLLSGRSRGRLRKA
jgi:hypothetical protein